MFLVRVIGQVMFVAVARPEIGADGIGTVDGERVAVDPRFQIEEVDSYSPPGPSLADLADDVVAAADAKAFAVRAALTAGISPAEMASWPIKRSEAIAYQAAGVQATIADAPMLAIEAQARGISVAALADKVLAKAQALSALEAAIAGRCGAIQDAARAATTMAQLQIIDVEAGWPA